MKDSFKQSAIMSIGTITNSLLGLIFYIVVARILGPADFGNFSFLLGFGLLAAEVGDLGLGSALVRFGSGSDFRGVFTITLGQRIIAAMVFFFIAFIAGGDFYLAALAAVSLQFVSLITQTFLAKQKYGLFITTNIFGNLFRLGLIWLFLSQLGVVNTLLAFSTANFIAFSVGFSLLLMTLKSSPFNIEEGKKMFMPVWNFSRWVALSFGVASIGGKMDVPIIFAIAGSSATGIYSSAQKLVSVFSQIASSIEGVFAPKFSADIQGKSFFKEYVIISFLVAAGLFVLPLFSGFFISLIFGAKYLTAIPVFNLMSLALIPFFLTGPFSATVLYRFGKSNYHLFVSLGQLVVSLLGYILLVPILGASGAAISVFISNLFGLLVYLLLSRKLK